MASLEVTLANGKKFTHTEKYRKGSPENPVDDKDVIKKYYNLAEYQFDRNKSEELHDKVNRLDILNDVSNFI